MWSVSTSHWPNSIPSRIEGTIWSVGRNAIEAVALPVPVGSVCSIQRRGRAPIPAEVIGFEGATTLLASLDGSDGIAPGDKVVLCDALATLRVGPGLIGRVIDAAGQPLDDLGPVTTTAKVPLDAPPIAAMQRPTIDSILTTGVRTIDTLLTLGRGQRIGIFAGSGVGKSTLMGMMARGTDADVVVIGLVGERGREVQEYLQRELDPGTRQKCVTVVATSDQPALRRVRAAMASTAIAEYFRDQGKHVLLMMDSVTRFAWPNAKSAWQPVKHPPRVAIHPAYFLCCRDWSNAQELGPRGSITGIYTVLVEGEIPTNPSAIHCAGLLDGHFVLSRSIAHRGRYPAIDILASLSRLHHHLADQHN
jgi:flagellum-specific ATP synthase